ncbi:MAG TPA: (d)CMP kinase [Peptococcaceae bacterium]|nr:(d)CMP kinase [Peptococcaceae bacterium]
MSRLPNIAIDGPAGSGKSTVARIVARKLSFFYIDTGAMYRAVTYMALKSSLDLDDREALAVMAGKLKFSYVYYSKTGEVNIWCNGEDVTPHIRTKEVSQVVAKVAAVPQVREHLVNYQRLLARGGGVVMEGRDIGTVVLPDAEYKFFLTADPEVRLERRERELREKGIQVNREELRREIIFRDQMDLQRETSPLKVASDAVVIDCTSLSVDQVVAKIMAICGGGRPGAL